MTMKTTDEAMAYLRGQHTSGSHAWGGMCLALQRTARDIAPMYPSAISAAHATPEEFRVYKLENVKRGMIAYWDDPNDSNPFGHITGVAGRDDDELLHWTNDAAGYGTVSLVHHSFFPNYWGDKFLFAATWLNGQELDMGTPKPPKPVKVGDNLRDAIKSLDKAIAYHLERDHPTLVKALKRDRAELQETLKKYGGK